MYMQNRHFKFQQGSQFNQTKVETYSTFTQGVYTLVSWELNPEDRDHSSNRLNYQQKSYEFSNAHELIHYIGSEPVRSAADEVFCLSNA
jgi:hypothetical protein